MTDLTDYLLPTKKRVITFDDLETDEAIAFNWFYQQQKKYNTHNRLINYASSFEELHFNFEDDGHWHYLKSIFGYKSESDSLIEEILNNCGVKVEAVTDEVFTPIDELIEEYEDGNCSIEKDFVNALIEAKANGYTMIHETGNDDVLKSYLELYDKKGYKYEKYNDYTYFTNDYCYTRIYYHKVSGNNIESIFYYIASANYYIDYITTEDGNYYLGFEFPYENDGFYELDMISVLVSLIMQDYLSFDKEDLIDYDSLFSSYKVNEFFNQIKIENTREVIF